MSKADVAGTKNKHAYWIVKKIIILKTLRKFVIELHRKPTL